MKKISLLTLIVATLLGGLATMRPVLATDELYWVHNERAFTVSELSALYDVLMAEVTEECKGVVGESKIKQCKSQTYNNRTTSDDRYKVHNLFIARPFLISAVNPAKGTVKVYFQNTDNMRLWTERDPNVITTLRLGWFDADKIPETSLKIPKDETEAPEGFHYIYSADVESHGENWISPVTEIEISAPEAGLDLNESNTIYFSYNSTYYNSSSKFSYASCVESPYYRPGDECRMVLSRTQSGQVFIPFRDGIPVGPDYILTDDGIKINYMLREEEKKTTTEQAPVTNDTIIKTVPVAVAATTSLTSEESNDEKVSENEEPLTTTEHEAEASNYVLPLGGEEKTANCYADFPWWFIAVVTAADVVIMWLFWPKKVEKL